MNVKAGVRQTVQDEHNDFFIGRKRLQGYFSYSLVTCSVRSDKCQWKLANLIILTISNPWIYSNTTNGTVVQNESRQSFGSNAFQCHRWYLFTDNPTDTDVLIKNINARFELGTGLLGPGSTRYFGLNITHYDDTSISIFCDDNLDRTETFKISLSSPRKNALSQQNLVYRF